MAKFRKKPVVIEAVQWMNDAAVLEAIRRMGCRAIFAGDETPALVIKTLEGDLRADLGDWIIKDVKGEFYPCKPDIFQATYEPVEDGDGGE